MANLNEQLLDDLRELHGLLTRGWCQNAEARDSKGQPCAVDDPDAAQWCIIGGMYRIGDPVPLRICNMRDALHEALPNQLHGLSGWNDMQTQTKREVLALVERAIARAADGKENETC